MTCSGQSGISSVLESKLPILLDSNNTHASDAMSITLIPENTNSLVLADPLSSSKESEMLSPLMGTMASLLPITVEINHLWLYGGNQ
jgi:hypothetical protein